MIIILLPYVTGCISRFVQSPTPRSVNGVKTFSATVSRAEVASYYEERVSAGYDTHGHGKDNWPPLYMPHPKNKQTN